MSETLPRADWRTHASEGTEVTESSYHGNSYSDYGAPSPPRALPSRADLPLGVVCRRRGRPPAEPPHEPYTFLKPRREESSEQSSDEGGDVLVTNQASYTSAVASEAERVLDVESRTSGGAVAAVLTFTT